MSKVAVYALLGWSSQHGLPATPVGALAVDQATGAHAAAWLPLTYDAATAWQRQLRALSAEDLRPWLTGLQEATSTLGLYQLLIPTDSTDDLQAGAELGLELLLSSAALGE